MEQLISPISTKTADEPVDESWIPKLALDYAYGQLQLSEKQFSCNFAVTRGNSSGYYQFLKHFFQLVDKQYSKINLTKDSETNIQSGLMQLL